MSDFAEDKLYTLEDIKSKYKICFLRNVYGSIEEDIVNIFNNTEYIEDKFLNKCDVTGIYDHVFSLWYSHIKGDNEKHKELNLKSINKNFVRAMFHRAYFHDNVYRDEKINLLKQAIKIDPEYVIAYGELAQALLVDSLHKGNKNLKLLLEANSILYTGLEKGCPDCGNILAKLMLQDKEFSKARYFSTLSYNLLQSNPLYNQASSRIAYNKLQKKIDDAELFAINYHGHIKQEKYIPG